MAPSETANESGRSLTARLVAVLATLDSGHPRRRLSDIARLVDLPMSTVHRLLADLCATGLVHKDSDGWYSGGLRLWELGSSSARPAALRDAAMPYMQDLYEVTHENVHLGVLDDDQVLYLAKLHGVTSFQIETAPGSRLPWGPSGIGKAIAAFLDEDRREALLQRPLPRLTPRTITDPGRMREELARVRQQGHAFNVGEMSMGSFSVAAPIFDWQDRPVAAVSITSHRSKAELTGLVTAVKTVARATARRLAAGEMD